jgi:hypothetical protein
MVANADTSNQTLKISNRSALMRRFNESFPAFYGQFVSSEVQAQNLRLAYTLYQTRKAVVQITDERNKSVLSFAYRNQSFLLSDIFGVLTAFNLSIHGVNLYGQIYAPHLVFMRIVISRNGAALPYQTKINLERAIHESLTGAFDVEETLALEFNLKTGLSKARVTFYVDQVFHLPAILIEADHEPGLFYKIMHALWKEELLVININLIVRKDQTRFIFYLLGPNASATIPDYLGQKMAANLRNQLGALP